MPGAPAVEVDRQLGEAPSAMSGRPAGVSPGLAGTATSTPRLAVTSPRGAGGRTRRRARPAADVEHPAPPVGVRSGRTVVPRVNAPSRGTAIRAVTARNEALAPAAIGRIAVAGRTAVRRATARSG